MHASYYMCNPGQNWLITLHIFKNDSKTSYTTNIQYNHVKIYSLKDVHSGGKNQKPTQNNHIWLVVVLWRCFSGQLPVQNNHFRVVPRVVVLYRFDCIKSFFFFLKCPIKDKRSSLNKKNDWPKKYLLKINKGIINGTKYSRMDQVRKTAFKKLKGYGLLQADHTPSNFLRAFFNKFYLVHSWILCYRLHTYKWITNTVLENGLILGRCICNYFFYGNHL